MKEFIKNHKRGIIIALSVLTVLSVLTLRIFDIQLKNGVCKGGIISFELAKGLDRSVEILNSWGTRGKIHAGLSLGFDFLFLLVYSIFISILIFIINNRLRGKKFIYKLGNFLIILTFVAALLDITENIALIRLLSGDLRQVWSSVAYYSASVKFGIVFFDIVYLIVNWSLLMLKKVSFKNIPEN